MGLFVEAVENIWPARERRDSASYCHLSSTTFVKTSTWIDVLLRRGFAVSSHELSYGIEVHGPFTDRIDSGNRKRLQKCIRDGMTASILNRTDFKSAYDVVAENRSRKGYELSLSWDAFETMADAMPERVNVLRGQTRR
jgi:hypothetical protein